MEAAAPGPDERGTDAGFTLIELMIVVLIIAILLAIATPTYLSLRKRANDRAVQSNIRTAHSAELAVYSDGEGFIDDVTRLRAVESTLKWTVSVPDMALGPDTVLVTLGTTDAPNDTLVLGGKSPSGNCFWLRTVGDRNILRFATNDCAGVPVVFSDAWD